MTAELAADPIIITGAARSGTTYLVQILNSHPEVAITDEIRLFVWVHKVLRELPHDQNVIFRHRDEFVDFLSQQFPELIRTFYRALNPGRRFWGDKNPHYLSAPFATNGGLETIRELFSGTRFINIVRDGRDVVCSGMRGVWKNFDSVHQMWTSHVRHGRQLAAVVPPDHYFELRYEELVRDDVGMATRIFQFLRIPMHPKVLSFCQNQMQKRTPFARPSRDLAKGARNSDWNQMLNPAQKLRSLELLGPELIDFGYETEATVAEAKRSIASELASRPSNV